MHMVWFSWSSLMPFNKDYSLKDSVSFIVLKAFAHVLYLLLGMYLFLDFLYHHK